MEITKKNGLKKSKMNTERNKTIVLAIVIFLSLVVVLYIFNFSAKEKNEVKNILTPLLIENKEQLFNDVETFPLPNGKTLYFGISTFIDGEIGTVSDCGSGGCWYDFYVGSNLTEMKRIIGFDKYYLNCDTSIISFEKDEDGEVFGFIKSDKINRIVSVYEHFSAYLGTENVYYIMDSGYPKLIASYDNICSDEVVTLFRDLSFPRNLTEFK